MRFAKQTGLYMKPQNKFSLTPTHHGNLTL